MRFLSIAALLLTLMGCNAVFTDFRDLSAVDPGDDGGGIPTGDAGPLTDAAPPADAGSGGTPDAGSDELVVGVLSEGAWEGRTGYNASGTARIERSESGALELVFSDDFDSARVPGPVVVLTERDSIGRAGIQPGDLDLGILQSTGGGQRYPLPEGAERFTYAWVYCLPFTVEVARAPLEATP